MTVRHILQQRSGLGESGDFMADWTTFQPESDELALERLFEGWRIARCSSTRTAQEWSDVSYTILGDVIAKVSGQSFETYMQDHILSPLGMAHSSFLLNDWMPGSWRVPTSWRAANKLWRNTSPTTGPLVLSTT